MNAKNFKEVTRQVAVIKTQNRTLAIYANLRPVSIESGEDFMTIIDGKFKLDLNDFSNGKGDNAKHVQFNLDIKDIKYLYARAKMFDMPMPYNIIKNYTMPEAIIKDGPDKGKAKTKKIFISRTSVDEKTGKPMRSPWAIQIENGVSRPKNGGRSSVEIEPNSYQCRVRGYMRINDIDFLDFIDKAYTYMEEYRHIIAQDIVPRGEKILDEMQKRRGNTYNTVPPEEYIPESPGLVSSEQPEENFSKSSNAPVSTNSATQSNKRPQLYEVVAIIGELQGYEDTKGYSGFSCRLFCGNCRKMLEADSRTLSINGKKKRYKIWCCRKCPGQREFDDVIRKATQSLFNEPQCEGLFAQNIEKAIIYNDRIDFYFKEGKVITWEKE